MSESTIDCEFPSRPLRVADVEAWHETVDVLVVGYGGAGACAAIEAARAGASTLVLERASGGGGTTALAGGVLYLGGGTRVQKACGIDDSPEEMLRYLTASTPDPDAEKFRLYTEGSVAHFDWLVAQGVPFKDALHEERTTQPENDDGLFWSGNEKSWPYRDLAKPAPRGHKVQAPGDAGALLFSKLHDAAIASGVRIAYETRVVKLVLDEGGAVVGVVARCAGRDLAYRARGGVVLCAGGFVMNDAMRKRHLSRLDGRVIPIGNPYDDGAGLRLGLSARGAGIHLDEYHITVPYYPPSSLTYGILVNGQGQRFIAEDAYHGRLGEISSRQPLGRVYLIVDEASFGRPVLEGFEVVAVEGSIAELEQALALPAQTLVRTVELFNRHAEKGEDPVLHKQPAWLRPLEAPPYAAFDLSFGKATYMAFSLGGLWTRASGEVLTEDGEVVEGLYAAGRTCCGVSRSAEGYVSGTSIGDATFFGRLAGRAAAARRTGR
jgi:3-oxo-5alpha-steroid 4-dehydrogenase